MTPITDPFTAASPTYQAARYRGCRPMPLAAGEVAEFGSRRTWRFWARTIAQLVAVASFTGFVTAALLSPLYS